MNKIMEDLQQELGREFTQEELFYYSTIYKPKKAIIKKEKIDESTTTRKTK